jgi:hypothetical protein
MQNAILIGIGAGLASAALYSTVVSYSLLAFILLYLAPLPLFIAGFGWGAVTAGIGAIAGSLAIMIATGFKPGLLFFLSVGLSPILISHLAQLSRPVPPGTTGPAIASDREYYPEGRMVLWLAAMAGLLVTVTVLILGPDAESFRAAMRDMLSRSMTVNPALQNDLPQANTEELKALIEIFVRLMPPVSGVLWLLAAFVNVLLAAKIVTASNRALRPWAPFHALSFPRSAVYGPLAAMVLAILPGTVGIVGETYVAVLLAAFALVGLASIHRRTLGLDSRPLILGAVYGVLLIFNWIVVLALSGIGITQTMARRDTDNGGSAPNGGLPPVSS